MPTLLPRHSLQPWWRFGTIAMKEDENPKWINLICKIVFLSFYCVRGGSNDWVPYQLKLCCQISFHFFYPYSVVSCLHNDYILKFLKNGYCVTLNNLIRNSQTFLYENTILFLLLLCQYTKQCNSKCKILVRICLVQLIKCAIHQIATNVNFRQSLMIIWFVCCFIFGRFSHHFLKALTNLSTEK